MDAQLVFENLLKQAMDSCLNCKLEMSPFSAVIQLKKSFIRDKSGIPVFPSSSTPLPTNLVLHESETQEWKSRLNQIVAAKIMKKKSFNPKLKEKSLRTLLIV